MPRILALSAVSLNFIIPGCFRDLARPICDDPETAAPCSPRPPTNASTSDSSTTSNSSSSSTTSSCSSSSDTSTNTTDTTASSSSDTSTDEGADTTTGPAPFCGDGIVQPGAPLFEECDDGFADQQCNLLCKRNRVVFVASLPLFKAGGLQGIQGADNYCVSRAGMAGLPQFLLFKALLSDSQHDAATRMFNGEGRYVLVDGTVVADDWASLLTKPLQHPIELTEKGEVLHVSVWTGTEHGTGKLVPGADNCDDWTSYDPDKEAYWGRSIKVDPQWIQSNQLNPTDCLADRSIYCIEQE